MVVIKDGREYYTSDELKTYLHQKAVEDAGTLSREILHKKNTFSQEVYV